MAETKQITHIELLSISECPSCFISYGMPQELEDRRLKDGGPWYCPNGHSISFTKSEADKLREQLNNAKSRLASAEDRATHEANRRRDSEAMLDATLKEQRRLKRRINAGTCPHCRRTFQQVHRHIQNKHPEKCAAEA